MTMLQRGNALFPRASVSSVATSTVFAGGGLWEGPPRNSTKSHCVIAIFCFLILLSLYKTTYALDVVDMDNVTVDFSLTTQFGIPASGVISGLPAFDSRLGKLTEATVSGVYDFNLSPFVYLFPNFPEPSATPYFFLS